MNYFPSYRFFLQIEPELAWISPGDLENDAYYIRIHYAWQRGRCTF